MFEEMEVAVKAKCNKTTHINMTHVHHHVGIPEAINTLLKWFESPFPDSSSWCLLLITNQSPLSHNMTLITLGFLP